MSQIVSATAYDDDDDEYDEELSDEDLFGSDDEEEEKAAPAEQNKKNIFANDRSMGADSTGCVTPSSEASPKLLSGSGLSLLP